MRLQNVSLHLSICVVADEFSKHKTLGELILIDRVTNMTSACGVVTEVKEDGQEAGKKADQLRAVIKGQRAATIPFDLSDENITRSFVEQVEKELTLGGRHTYLYAPKDDEPVGTCRKTFKQSRYYRITCS